MCEQKKILDGLLQSDGLDPSRLHYSPELGGGVWAIWYELEGGQEAFCTSEVCGIFIPSEYGYDNSLAINPATGEPAFGGVSHIIAGYSHSVLSDSEYVAAVLSDMRLLMNCNY